VEPRSDGLSPSNALAMDFAMIQLSQDCLIAIKNGARQFSAAVTALLLVGGAFFVFVFAVSDLQAKDPDSNCAGATEVAVLSSPIAPWKGAPLRVVVAAEEPVEGELWLIAPDGKEVAKSRERHGGPPYFWFAEVTSPAVGTWQATLVREDVPTGCSTITCPFRKLYPRVAMVESA
jgi:hypothetical protein